MLVLTQYNWDKTWVTMMTIAESFGGGGDNVEKRKMTQW